jgi:hypothetical protein
MDSTDAVFGLVVLNPHGEPHLVLEATTPKAPADAPPTPETERA